MAGSLLCSSLCGIFPDQGWTPCLLHQQVDSPPLRHQGSTHVLVDRFINRLWRKTRSSAQFSVSRLFSVSLAAFDDGPGFRHLKPVARVWLLEPSFPQRS